MTIAENIAHIHQKMKEYERLYHRTEKSVSLLAVSKNQSLEKIEAAYSAGQRAFGENYLQEALAKITALSHLAIEWHFIGPIQRNKTRKIAENFSWVQSVDDLVIAKRLSEQRPTHLPPLNICIQVNINHETTKSGIPPTELIEFAKTCIALPQLHVRGLMAIPAPTTDIHLQRKTFHQIYLLWQQCVEQGFAFDTLSIGMSDDFEAAIAEGSTLIRLGTAIFGSRS